MKRIIFSTLLILGTIGALVAGGTGAFFSDSETSVGNVFVAGAIDLKVDNESYYNGVLNEDTSWDVTDLTIEKFFNFSDLKPSDYGEDTISLHVDTNDAYLCADVTLTSNNENGQNEPEAAVDPTAGPTQGELANLVNFVWWADDGDNVLETNENVISQGPIGGLTLGVPYPIALADSDENIWTGVGGPVPGLATRYIGKAWCFGTMGIQKVAADNSSTIMSPAGNNDGNLPAGQPTDGGITCDGSLIGNESQTDSLTADVSFEAIQSRNNASFQCEGDHCEISEVQTIIPNSTFEVPVVANVALWDAFPSPAGNWNVEWRGDVPASFGDQIRPNPAKLEIHKGVVGTPNEGLQYAELDSDWAGPDGSGDGEPASISIYQDIPTIAGNNYRIKFVWAARPNTLAADNRVGVEWNNVSVYDSLNLAGGGGDIVWNEITINVTATGPVTRLRFTDLGTANSIGTFIDNIRLFTEVCVPPPPQIVLDN